MTIDTNTMISITEANQNFSKVTKLVDEHGTAVILKNNVPRYLVIDFSKAEKEKIAATEDVLSNPFQSFGGEELYPSIQAKAAQLCFGLVKNHSMVDGNKISVTALRRMRCNSFIRLFCV